MKIVLWRRKTNESLPFNEEFVQEEDENFIRLSATRFGRGMWWKKSEIEIGKVTVES